MFLTLALVTALFTPAKPTVGDRVTISFEQPAVLDPSPDYEIVAKSDGRIVLRTFQPKPLVLSGTAGGVRFRNLVLPVASVLRPKDDLEPAALAPPVGEPASRLPWIVVAVAALLAIALWLTAWLRSGAKLFFTESVRPPAVAFRDAVTRAARARQPWATLADATRGYLAARGIGRELTTAQLVTRLPAAIETASPQLTPPESGAHVTAVSDILHRGDLEKFSPWGAPPGDFPTATDQALSLIPLFEPEPPEEKRA